MNQDTANSSEDIYDLLQSLGSFDTFERQYQQGNSTNTSTQRPNNVETTSHFSESDLLAIPGPKLNQLSKALPQYSGSILAVKEKRRKLQQR